MRRFELVKGKSSKFWEIDATKSQYRVRWGKIGSVGRSIVKRLRDDEARATMHNIVLEKIEEGYVEVPVRTVTPARRRRR